MKLKKISGTRKTVRTVLVALLVVLPLMTLSAPKADAAICINPAGCRYCYYDPFFRWFVCW
jgi:hypothetical protein